MARFMNQWDYQYYGTSSTTSGNWYQYDEYERYRWAEREKERYHREMVSKMAPPPAYEISVSCADEQQIRKALGPAPKKEETLLDWLHKRVNEVCDDALAAVV